MHSLSRVVRFCASVQTAPSPVPRPVGALVARLRSFTGGFVLASAASFYILYFQLHVVTDELRLAIADVKRRQEDIERTIVQKD